MKKTGLLIAAMLMAYFPSEPQIYQPDHYEQRDLYEYKKPLKLLPNKIKHFYLTVLGFISGHYNAVLNRQGTLSTQNQPFGINKLRTPHTVPFYKMKIATVTSIIK